MGVIIGAYTALKKKETLMTSSFKLYQDSISNQKDSPYSMKKFVNEQKLGG